MSDFASQIDSLPPLREIIAAHALRAEKKLGQNFILDLNITDKIARAAGVLPGMNVVEIGPGPGGLTRSLLRGGAEKVAAVEFDPRAVAALEGLAAAAAGRLTVVPGDALQTDPRLLVPAPRMIIANLPYNIATPLLVRWLSHLRADPLCYTGMVLMFQKEVAERLVAVPGRRAYGRLSVLAQWLCAVDLVFDLPPSVFTPPPKITSSLVRFVPRALAPGAPAFEMVEKITVAAFGQRRKMVKAGLKPWPGLLARAGIDETRRAEQLEVADFIRLAVLAGSDQLDRPPASP